MNRNRNIFSYSNRMVDIGGDQLNMPTTVPSLFTPSISRPSIPRQYILGFIALGLIGFIFVGIFSVYIDALGSVILSIIISIMLLYFVTNMDSGKKLWEGVSKTRLGLSIFFGLLFMSIFIIFGVVNQNVTYDYTIAVFFVSLVSFGIVLFLINKIKWERMEGVNEKVRKLKRSLRKVKTIPPDELVKDFNNTLDRIESKMVTEPNLFDNIDGQGVLKDDELKKVRDMYEGISEIIKMRRTNPSLFEQERAPRVDKYVEIFGKINRQNLTT